MTDHRSLKQTSDDTYLDKTLNYDVKKPETREGHNKGPPPPPHGAPQYMLDLYNSYKHSHPDADIIRSFINNNPGR